MVAGLAATLLGSLGTGASLGGLGKSALAGAGKFSLQQIIQELLGGNNQAPPTNIGVPSVQNEIPDLGSLQRGLGVR